MYWGLVLKSNKRYSQQIVKGFHVSNATLDLGTVENKDAIVSVWVHTDDEQHLLCNLSKHFPQVALDLVFSEGETIAFFTKGNGTVHLNGNIMQDDEFGDLGEMGDEEQDDEELEDDEIDYEALKKSLKKKAEKAGKAGKAKKSNDVEEDDDEESDDESVELAEDDDTGGEEDSDTENGEEEEDSADSEQAEDSDTDDDDVSTPPAKQPRMETGAKKQQNGLTNGKAQSKEKEQTKKQKGDKKEKDQQQQQQQKPLKKTLSNGVVIEDIRVGKGPEATNGKRVSVYYVGRLQKNNKMFDSTTTGEGFKFQLGRNEVIRGWEIGILGMRVGGKRRITCPPNVAYGAKGSPPVIPPNATLIFDVELRSL